MDAPQPRRGRGAANNPGNRFESLHYDLDPEVAPDEQPAPSTQFFKDKSRSLIVFNDSPDLGFDAGINPYRGCEHGCIYCYARPYHEYLGMSPGLDFETKILVKEDAPRLLRRELSSPKWQPQTIALSGITDAYQPAERRLKITRACLEVLVEFRNPVAIITKNALVARDADLLAELAKYEAAVAFVSVTTLDPALARALEPRASTPQARLDAMRALSSAGVPVGVMAAPMIPGLNDHEMPAILEAAANAGARHAGYTALRLPHGLGSMFEEWLERHVPESKEKVLGRIRDMRGGKLNDPRFGTRMKGEGVLAEMLKKMFAVACRKVGLDRTRAKLSTSAFRRPGGTQLLLFE